MAQVLTVYISANVLYWICSIIVSYDNIFFTRVPGSHRFGFNVDKFFNENVHTRPVACYTENYWYSNTNCWTEYPPITTAGVNIYQLQLLDWIFTNWNCESDYSSTTTAGLNIHQLRLLDWVFTNYNCVTEYSPTTTVTLKKVVLSWFAPLPPLAERYAADITKISNR